MPRYFKPALVLVLAVPVLLTVLAVAQQNPKRLILKDGTYQAVTQWNVVGNRVRYYSAERYSWEELPKDLVDWPATDKFNQERDARHAANEQQLAQQEAAEHRDAEPESPQVAPGLRLPDGGGVFLLDTFKNEAQLVELLQSGGELNKQMGKNILRAAMNPLSLSSKQTIELQGIHAKSQSHLVQPEIFVDVDNTDENSSQPEDGKGKKAELPPDRFRIVRLEIKKSTRVVGNLNIAVYGKVSQKENWIKTTSTPMGEWVKVVPAAPLPPGEYAVVEMLDRKQINLYVWDFGVDPKAPVNRAAWTARQPVKDKEGADETPKLQQRPKN